MFLKKLSKHVDLFRTLERRTLVTIDKDRQKGTKTCKVEGSGTSQRLLKPMSSEIVHPNNKITVVGAGQVGMAVVFTLLAQDITSDICIVDMNENKLLGEMLDLQHGSLFLKDAQIHANKDFAVTSGSKICVVTAGVRQKEKETRLDLVKRNADVLNSIIPQLLKYSPNCIIVLASNPVDILTYVTWKISGLPKHRIIGSGTNLDSARFRFLLSQRLQVAPSSCHGYIIGEHGDSMVPVWSGVNVSGVRLRDLNPEIGTEKDPEHWQDIFKEVVNSGYHVRSLKGCTSWAIGLSIADICKSIVSNANSVHPVSTLVTGEHCIEDEIFLSLPCILGYNGVTNIVRLQLTDTETTLLHKSADIITTYLQKM